MISTSAQGAQSNCEDWANWAKSDCSKCSIEFESLSKLSKLRSPRVYNSWTRHLYGVVFNSIDQTWFLLSRCCSYCWSIRDIISLLLVVVPWQTSPLDQTQVIFHTLVEGDLTEINMTLKIMRDDREQFSIIHEKLQISKNKIDEYIKEHHDESLQKHFDIAKIIQLLRQNCQFSNMRQKVETYIKKCFNC